MGITLTSKAINSTYDSLLKLSDNDQLTGAFKVITDGLGNDTGISINNTNQVNIAGQLVVNSSITANSFVRSGGLSSQFLKADGSVDSNTYQSVHQKGLANGYAPLDGGAKISEAYLPDSIVGQLEYQGTWNATTNTPTLPSASTVKGHYYVTSVAGTYQTIEYAVGDWVISNGTSWEKVDNTDAVTTVFGRIGAILADVNDYSTFYHPKDGDLAANASTATTLQTARFINGTSFNGSANITTAIWGSSRTITIGDTAKSLNGSINEAWSRAELGITKVNIDALNIDADTLDGQQGSYYAAAGSLSNYLPLTGGTLTGGLNVASGNVGIGTVSPSYKLDVNADGIGGIRSVTNVNGWAGWFENTNSSSGVVVTAGVDTGDAPLLIRKQDGTELFSVRGNGTSWFNNGNVGIGTTSPSAKLNVNQENGISTVAISRGGTNLGAGTALGNIIFPADYAGTPTNYASIDAYANALSGVRGSLDFKVKSTSGSLLTGMTVYGTNAGVNVGIGTTAPSQKLEVNGNIQLTNQANSILFGSAGASGTWGGAKISRIDSNIIISDYSGVQLGGYDGTSYGPRVTIKGTGNVGIGTTSPAYKLDVAGAIRSSQRLWLSGIDALSIANSDLRMGYTNSNILFRTNSAERMRIDASGNVGIGTTSPVTKLDVSGGILASGNIATSSGNISAGSGYMSANEYKLASSSNNGRFIGNTDWGTRHYTDSGYIHFGPANSSHAHIYTDRPSFYLNKEILINNNIVWNAGNDGSGSGLDADLLDGQQGSYYDHRGYTVTNNYLGGFYISGGTEKPNSSVFGAGKFKVAMLRGGALNLGFGGTWNDVLWTSTYNGGDVKRSLALVSSKHDDTSVWIAKQNFDATNWGTGHLIWNSGNDGSGSGLDADLLDGQHASAFVPERSYNNWNDGTIINKVIGQLAWKNYGNNHTVFDASASTSPTGTSINNTNPSVTWTGTYPTLMGWNGTETYGVRVDVSRYAESPKNSTFAAAGDFRAPIFYDSNNTAFYVDPNNTSRFNKIQTSSSGATPRYDTAFYVIQGQHWYGDTGSQIMYLGESGNDVLLRGQMSIGTASISAAYALTMGGHIDMNNSQIDYASQLHFNDNVRFYQDGNDSYLNFKYGDASAGGIKFLRGDGTIKGYVYADNAGFGLLDNDGAWALRTRTGTSPLSLYCDGNEEFLVYTSYTYSPGSSRAPIFYDSDNTAYYLDPASTSNLYDLQLTGAKNTYLYINPGNGNEAMVRFNGGSGSTWYIGSRTSTQLIASTDAHHIYSQTASQTVGGYDTAGNHFALGSSRAPIFYDSNNTAYYVDPASTSNVNIVNFVGYSSAFGGFQVSRNLGTTSPSWQDASHTLGLENSDAGYLSINFHRGGYTSNNIWYTGAEFITDDTWRSNVDMKAPIFYDSNDTGYYLDPAGQSRLGNIERNTHSTGFLVGSYNTVGANSTNTNPIYAIGDAYKPTDTSLSNMYGIGYTHGGNAPFVSLSGATSWGMYVAADGDARIFLDASNGIVVSTGSSRAPIFYDSNDTAYYIDGGSISRLNILNVNAVGTNVAGIGKVLFPYGAEYNGSSSVNGALKITLPKSWSNTMMSMKIVVFEYATNESFEISCGGYNYTGSGGTWVNTHAKIIASGKEDRNFNIRFGHDGAKCCIYIGETTTNWSYPKVVVTEWIGGHSAETFSNWDNGWAISAVTSLGTITSTESNSQIGRYQSIIYDVNDTTYYLDPDSTSRAARLRGEILIGPNTSSKYLRLGGNGGATDYSTISTSNGNLHIDSTAGFGTYINHYSSGVVFVGAGGGYLYVSNSARAPIFYDVDNTGYYVDPAGISNLSQSKFLAGISVNSGSSSATKHGISLYGTQTTGMPAYGLAFTGTAGEGTHGSVTSDWATYFTMSGSTSRGWIFKHETNRVASISGTGNASFNGDVTANKTFTSYTDLVASDASAIRFWNGSNGYSIRMSGATSTAYGGRVAGETTSDYNMYFTMGGGTNRGFVFRSGESSSYTVAGIDASGNGRFEGDVIAYSASDKRLKDNIKPIENALDKVNKISGVEFDWNSNQDTYQDGMHDIGVIAQEIEDVIPEVVKTRDNGYKAVKYEKIVPLLIEAIKEQQKQIEELKQLINK